MLTVASIELSDVRVTVAVNPSALVIPKVIVTVGSADASPGTAAAAVGAGKENTISPSMIEYLVRYKRNNCIDVDELVE